MFYGEKNEWMGRFQISSDRFSSYVSLMGIRLILERFVKDDSSSDIENHKFYRNKVAKITKNSCI